jgi:hypothetical protein
MRNHLLTTTNMAAMTSHATEESFATPASLLFKGLVTFQNGAGNCKLGYYFMYADGLGLDTNSISGHNNRLT